MTYKIESIKENDVICVRYNCGVTMTERMAAVHEVSIKKDNFKPLRLLIDVRKVKQKMNESEQAIFGKYLASVEEFKTALVAVLTPEIHNPNTLINKVSVQAGYNLMEFNSEQDALSWLKQ
ncbi:MAG: hypothetical protein V7785_23225 [Bermanella sp.]